ncbi:major facilitator superfamily domain-containing protein [Flagelloscypha sp. PMI_526]|nr:major facilitator superfamily domain-containing protein [Flagelloscypha sp. PMI_526]
MSISSNTIIDASSPNVEKNGGLAWDDDPHNPLNWSARKKWTTTYIARHFSGYEPLTHTVVLVHPSPVVFSSMIAPVLDKIAVMYGETNTTVIGLTLSIYLLLFAFAVRNLFAKYPSISDASQPLMWAPVSEMHGRSWALHIANIGCLAFNLGCAFSPTIDVLIVMRLFTGFFAAASMTIGPASISDLFTPQDRGSAMALYSLGPLLGPTVGPVIAGYVGQSLEIKWIFIIMALISAGAAVIGIPLLRETYAPVLLLRRAKKEGKLDQFFEEHPEFVAGRTWKDKASIFWINLSRPTILLFQNLTLFMLALYLAVLYGLLYLLFSTLFSVFGEGGYGFNSGAVGLASLGLGVGTFLGAIAISKFGAKIYDHLAARDGESKPEHRLPSLIIGSFFPPIGLLWYGWSAQARLHWIMPIVGGAIFSFGMMVAWLPIQLYVVDVFVFAASASSTLAVFRSLVAFCFPLFAEQMFDKLGLGPGCSLLAGIAIVLGIPFPIWLYLHGERLRKQNKHTKGTSS